MKITIENMDGLRMAVNSCGKDATRAYLMGIEIRPDGTVTGSDGHRLTTVKDCATGNEEPILIQFLKTIPASEVAGYIDTDAGLLITESARGAKKGTPIKVLDCRFPEWDTIVQETEDYSKIERHRPFYKIKFNPLLVSGILKGLKGGHIPDFTFGENPLDAFRIEYPSIEGEIISVVMPVR